jgi:hypothetical protein
LLRKDGKNKARLQGIYSSSLRKEVNKDTITKIIRFEKE